MAGREPPVRTTGGLAPDRRSPTTTGVVGLILKPISRLLIRVGLGGASGSHFDHGLLSLHLESRLEHICLLPIGEEQRLTLVNTKM